MSCFNSKPLILDTAITATPTFENENENENQNENENENERENENANEELTKNETEQIKDLVAELDNFKLMIVTAGSSFELNLFYKINLKFVKVNNYCC